jgi:hypothetical protein
MSDEPFYAPNRTTAPRRVGRALKHREVLGLLRDLARNYRYNGWPPRFSGCRGSFHEKPATTGAVRARMWTAAPR